MTEWKKRKEMVKMFYLYGVIEDMEDSETAEDDVIGLGETLGSFTKIFVENPF